LKLEFGCELLGLNLWMSRNREEQSTDIGCRLANSKRYHPVRPEFQRSATSRRGPSRRSFQHFQTILCTSPLRCTAIHSCLFSHELGNREVSSWTLRMCYIVLTIQLRNEYLNSKPGRLETEQAEAAAAAAEAEAEK
jgi:hypothetical protein